MRTGNIVKRTVGGLATAPLLARRTRRALADRTAIVCAHYVGDWEPHYLPDFIGATPEKLDAQLTRLKRWFRFAPLSEVLAFNAQETGPEDPLLAVTFDDGFDMLRDGVIDVLAEHGVSATTFVLTSTLDNANLMWRHKLYAIKSLRPRERYEDAYNKLAARAGYPEISAGSDLLRASLAWPMERKEELIDELWRACDMPALSEYLEEHRPYFTWEGLQEWRDRGHTVGFHSATHPLCPRLSDDAIEDELIEPARQLGMRLGVSSLPFSYPFGTRLEQSRERRLYEHGLFDCLLGIGGFSPRGTAPDRLERASFEGDLSFPVFGRAFVGQPRAPRPPE